MEEVKGKALFFLVFQGTGHTVVVAVKPLVAQLDCLQWVHLHEVGDVLLNQLLHLLYRYPVRYSLLFKEAKLVFIFVLFLVTVFVVTNDRLASFETVLDLV